MSNKVVSIVSGITDKDINPDVILENAKGELSGVVLVGYHKDGSEFFASSYADGANALWLIERLKKALLDIDE